MKAISSILITPILLLQLSCNSSKIADASVVSGSKSNKKIEVYTTAENTNLKLSLSNNFISNNTQQTNSTVSINVNTEQTDQTFLGIGGAITDASAEVFAKLSPKKQQEFLNA